MGSPANYSINLVAHSLGNAVVGEALREGMPASHYAMLHAATSASCYSNSHFSYQVTNVGVPTADTDTDSNVRNLAYTSWLGSISAPIINFADNQDSAVGGTWNYNNDHFKPQNFVEAFYTGHYYYDPSLSADQRLGVVFLNRDVAARSVTDVAEAKAYADYSLTGSIGFNETQGGSVGDYVDDSYFGDNHSAEWQLQIQSLETFYNMLLLKFELPRNP
jgi:hypothetical protein